MPHPTWNLDDGTQVTFKYGAFGKSKILINGQEAARTPVRKKTAVPVPIPGRQAEMTIQPVTGMRPDIELKVDGQVVLSEAEKKEISCLRCGRRAALTDKFCQKCGAEIPGGEDQRRIIKLRGARKVIAWVGFLFFASGLIIFAMQQGTAEDALAKLASYKDTDVYPQPIDGKQVTVGELREQVRMEPISTLVANGILTLTMVGLFFYARRSPLVGLVAALGIYLAVNVLNAVLSPETIGQGILMKIIVIGLLVSGIRSALELRKVKV